MIYLISKGIYTPSAEMGLRPRSPHKHKLPQLWSSIQSTFELPRAGPESLMPEASEVLVDEPDADADTSLVLPPTPCESVDNNGNCPRAATENDNYHYGNTGQDSSIDSVIAVGRSSCFPQLACPQRQGMQKYPWVLRQQQCESEYTARNPSLLSAMKGLLPDRYYLALKTMVEQYSKPYNLNVD